MKDIEFLASFAVFLYREAAPIVMSIPAAICNVCFNNQYGTRVNSNDETSRNPEMALAAFEWVIHVS
jgi:hypothetical protein